MNKPSSEIADTKTISLATLRLMAEPLRARLLGLFASGPTTVRELAAELQVPVTRLYYHVHLLEKHGLVRVVDSHPAGGTLEKVYQASARQFIVDPQEFAVTGTKARRNADILIDFALTESGKAIRRSLQSGVIDLRQSAPNPRALQIRRGSGRISTAQAAQIYQKIAALLDEFTRMDSKGSAQSEYMLALAFFPTALDLKE